MATKTKRKTTAAAIGGTFQKTPALHNGYTTNKGSSQDALTSPQTTYEAENSNGLR